MERILVLGAGGFIGKSLINKLIGRYDVVAFDKFNLDYCSKFKNVKTVIGDFSDTELINSLLEDIDMVIHLISTTGPSDNTDKIAEEINLNIIPTVNLLECMVKRGVKKIYFASSGGTIYGETGNAINKIDSELNPSCSYGVQKAIIELYLKYYFYRYGLEYRIMRITNPYGIGQDAKKVQGLIPILIKKLKVKEKVSVYGNGSNMRDYIYMDDLMDGIIKVLEYNGSMRIFHLGYGEYHSINEVIEKIEEIYDDKFSDIEYCKSRKCDVNRSLLDFDSTKNELNWFPKIGLGQGIKLLKDKMN